MNIRRRTFVLNSLLVMLILAIGSTVPQAQSVTVDSPEPVLDPNAYGAYVQGLTHEQRGYPDSAALYYQLAFRYFPGSLEIGVSLATMLHKLGSPQRAVNVLQETQDRDLQWYLLAARCYYELNEADSMRAAYLKITELDRENLPAFNILAGMYQRMGLVDSSLWAQEQVSRIRPDNFRTWQEIGRLNHRLGRYEEAVQAYRRSLNLDDTQRNLLAILGMAMVLSETGEYTEAVPYFLQTLEYDSLNTVANSQLALNYYRQDSLWASLRHTKLLLSAEPQDRRYARHLGRIYLALDSLDEAEFTFTQLIEDGDSTTFSFSLLGLVAMQKEEYDQAIKQFKQSIILGDSSIGNWMNIGLAFRSMEKYEDEVAVYYDAITATTAPQDIVGLHFATGISYERADKLDSTVAAFQRVLDIQPDNHQALNYLGYTLADRNTRLEYAKELIEKAMELSPDNAAYLDSYGWLLYRLTEYEEALEYLQRAAELDSDPVIFDHLGDIYAALGRGSDARVWWRKALTQDPDDDLVVALKEKLGN